jgi:uncharacterized delta-60 repeat protein
MRIKLPQSSLALAGLTIVFVTQAGATLSSNLLSGNVTSAYSDETSYNSTGTYDPIKAFNGSQTDRWATHTGSQYLKSIYGGSADGKTGSTTTPRDLWIEVQVTSTVTFNAMLVHEFRGSGTSNYTSIQTQPVATGPGGSSPVVQYSSTPIADLNIVHDSAVTSVVSQSYQSATELAVQLDPRLGSGLYSTLSDTSTAVSTLKDPWQGYKFDAVTVPAGGVVRLLITNTITIPSIYEIELYYDNSRPGAAPAITTQPASVTVNAGGSATFVVVATGSPRPTYQWNKDGSAISGATNAAYTIAATTTGDAGSYCVTLNNSIGAVTSATATLTVNSVITPPGAAPVITTQPSNLTVNAGVNATFAVLADGSPAPTYQWSKNGAAISGATNATYTIAAATNGDAGTYDVIVTNSLGVANSSPAILSVYATTTPPSNDNFANAWVLPGNGGTALGNNSGATGEPGEPTHVNSNGTATSVWFRWTPSVSGNAQVNTIGSFPLTALAVYTGSTVTGLTKIGENAFDFGRASGGGFPVTAGTTYSFAVGTWTGANDNIILNYAIPAAPTITRQPTSQTAALGGSAAFGVVVTGNNLSFEWFHNGAPVPGAAGSTLALTDLKSSDGGAYYVVVASDGGSVKSNTVTLSSANTAPIITAQPQSQSLTAGQTAALSVTASGPGTLTYQWRRSGLAIPAATTASCSIGATSQTDADSYDVVITAGLSTTVSAVARITVAPANYPSTVAIPNGAGIVFEHTGATVKSICPLPNGSAYVAGIFASANGLLRGGLVRLKADATVDPTFTPPYTESQRFGYFNPQALAVQSGGKLLVGGYIRSFSGASHLVRLNADGSLDTTWATRGFDNNVYAIAVQTDDKIIVGGIFTTYSDSNSGIVSRKGVARLNPDGTLDSAFNPNVGGPSVVSINAISIQADGKILLGGWFTTINGQSRNNLVRLNSDGSIDNTFTNDTGASSAVSTLAVQSDGEILVGGPFIFINGTYAPYLARLTPAGALDTGFSTPQFVEITCSIALQGDGRILVSEGRNIVRLNSNGTRDTTWNVTGDGSLAAIAVGADGRALIGGGFTSVNGAARNAIARINVDGTVDTTFNPILRSAGTVYGSTLLPGGKLLVVGSFDRVNGTPLPVSDLARFNADGTLDLSFNAGLPANAGVGAMVLQPDGHIVLAGTFFSPVKLTRITADGALDPGFPNGGAPNDTVNCLANAYGGRIVIGGDFTKIGTVARNHIARLNADGSLDGSFNPGVGPNDSVLSVAVGLNGKVWIGGRFWNVASQRLEGLARLNADGTPDTGFCDPGVSPIASIVLQPDGKVIAASLYRDPILGNYLNRFNADGTRDISFSPGTMDGSVTSITLQEDGKILVCGNFTSIGGVANTGYLARLDSNGGLDPTFAAYGLGAPIYTLTVRDNGQLFIAGSYGFGSGFTIAASAPIITTSPVAQINSLGGSATFTVTAAGAQPLSYQWIKGTAAVPGATTATLTISNVQPTDAGSYSVIVTNANGSVTSSAAALVVSGPFTSNLLAGNVTAAFSDETSYSSAGSYDPIKAFNGSQTDRWGVHPGSQYLKPEYGGSADGRSGSTTTPRDLWIEAQATSMVTFNTMLVHEFRGSGTSNYTLIQTQPGAIGPGGGAPIVQYSTTAIADLNVVHDSAITSVINQSYQSATELAVQLDPRLDFGTYSTLSDTSTAVWPLKNPLQGYKFNTVTVPAGGVVRLLIPNTITNPTIYEIELYYDASRPGGPIITSQPNHISVAMGGSATFNVTASTTALSYQWKKGTTAISGATTDTLTVSNVQLNDGGAYSVTVTNASGATTSNSAILSVPQFISVGDSGALLVSTDGQTWIARTSGTTKRLRAITASSGTMVAVGEAGTVLTSVDGITWISRTTGTTESLRGVAANGSIFVAVGGNNAALVLTSLDGIQWTQRTASGGTLRSIAWGNSQFVAVGANGTVLTSPDGATWTSRASGTAARLDGAIWTGSQFEVLSATGGLYVSDDALSWTFNQAYPPTWIEGLAWNDTSIVVVGAQGAIRTSNDGNSWISATSNTAQTIHGVTWTGSASELSGDPVQTVGNIDFRIVTSPLSQTVVAGATVVFNAVASVPNAVYQWFKDGVALVGALSDTLTLTNVQPRNGGSYSVTATNGTTTATSSAGVLTFRGQGTTGQQFIAVGQDGTILTSPEGFAWTRRTSGTTKRLRGAAASGNLIVTVGEIGTVLTSPDGATWTARTSGTAEGLRAVAASPTRFVAVGGATGSLILFSTDGIVWSQATVPVLGALRGIAYGNNTFVTVGQAGTILISSDGLTWSSFSSGTTDRLDGIVWTGSQFLTVSQTGLVLASSNGSSWTSSSGSAPAWLEGLTWSNTAYVVVGAGGEIATSPDGAFWTSVPSGTQATIHGVTWTGVPFSPSGNPLALLGNLQAMPTITGQPRAAAPAAGDTVNFSIVTSASSATYQWLKNGVPIASATNAALTLSNVQSVDCGQYSVVVRTATGSALSASATLIIPSGYMFSTYAGAAGVSGSTDGARTNARFSAPIGVAVDGTGNLLVADVGNHTLRRITPTGDVSTLAGLAGTSGYVDGTGAAVRFDTLNDIAPDRAGNAFLSEVNDYTIRKITASAVVTTIAGSPGIAGSTDATGAIARFNRPAGIALDRVGNLYVADSANNTIRRITAEGAVTTFAGITGIAGYADGPAVTATFSRPHGIAVDDSGNVFVADATNNTIRRITSNGVVITLAGQAGVPGFADGSGPTARFNDPVHLEVDGTGNVFVSDWANNTVRRVSPNGVVTTIGGLPGASGSTDGTGSIALFNGPNGIALDLAANLYVADQKNNTIRLGTPIPAVALPSFTTQPAGQTITAGGALNLSVGVSGPGPLAYQWLRNGSVITGATTASFTVANSQPGDAGAYSVVVTGAGGAVTSAPGSVTITTTPPTITNQPTSTSVLIGGTASFSVTATGTPAPTYQWQKNGNTISGATNATLTFLSAVTTDAGSYTVVVSNAASSITSNAATLTVNTPAPPAPPSPPAPPPAPANIAPTITTQPVGLTAKVGDAINFSIRATGTPAPTYQWRKDGTAVTGATANTLGLPSVSSSDAGSYDVVVANIAGTVTSAAATLVVNVPPTITTQPASLTKKAGETAVFSVTATGTPAPSYQWRKNGTGIAGATSSTLTLASLAGADAASYDVVVTNAIGAITSTAATLVVNVPPSFTTQPASGTKNAGETATFTVVATGTPVPTYQWFKDGTAVTGATGSSLTLTNLAVTDAGGYTVAASNAAGSATSDTATLSVNIPPAISASPLPQSGIVGGTAIFSVVATGTPVPSYQWRKNGIALTGATSTTLTLSGLQSADAGSYNVVVTNVAGSVTSSTAQLNVAVVATPPVITSQPVSATAASGSATQLVVEATGTPTPTYQWRKSGVAIAGATNAALTFGNLQVGDAGSYDVVVSNPAGTATSIAVTLKILSHSYAGVYFGSFGPGQGMFAIYIRSDNTGVLLGYLPNATAPYLNLAVVVDDAGNFSVTQPNATGATFSAGDNADPGSTSDTRHADAAGIVLTGVIGANGAVSGTVSGIAGATLSATKAPAAGSTQSVSGFYQAGATGSSATTYTIVNSAGQAFVLTQTSAGTDAGTGTVDSSGRLTVTTAHQQAVSGTVVPATSTLVATVTDPKGQQTTFTGATEGVVTLQRLVDISSRASVGVGDATTIAGFVIAGEQPKTVLIRAIGPTLATFGVGNTLAAPKLTLYRGSDIVASNTGWTTGGNADDIAAAATRIGAFTLAPKSADSAMLVTLNPGAYTAIMGSATSSIGVGLVEVYDLSPSVAGQKLINISTRAQAGTGDNTLIAGIVISGTVPKRVLIRAVGPTLSQFGVAGALARPELVLYKGSQSIAQNAGWSSSNDAAMIVSVSQQVGAFALPVGSADAAMIVNLDPGSYSAVVLGAGGTSGIAIVEVYDLP